MRISAPFLAAVNALALLAAPAMAQALAEAGPASPALMPPSRVAPAGAALTRANLEAWLDGFLPFALQQGDIAGAVILVLKDGEILLQKGYGYADVARKIPMDPRHTLVGVGSVSKLFTWTAVMQQVEQGQLDLDRDINEYIDFDIPPAFEKPITLRHLMTHTAGFEERTFKLYDAPRPLREHLKGVSVPERIYPPGTIPAYSNYGAMLAGYCVEYVSGEPFVAYIERHIFEPLGMERSTFRRPVPEPLQANLAKDYRVASGRPRTSDSEEPAGDPSGHLVTTATDVSRFMLAHLQLGRYRDHQLLRQETARLMHTPAFAAIPGAPGMALGFFQTDYNGRRIVGHWGDISEFHADLELLLDDGVGYFMAVNSTGEERGVFGAAYYLRASLFHRFVDRYFPTPPRPDEPTVATAREHARLVAGEYEMSRRASGDFMVAVDMVTRFAIGLAINAKGDDTIETPGLVSFEDGRPQTWREVGPFVWREVGGQEHLKMRIEDGRVRTWSPETIPSVFFFEPVPFSMSAALNVPLLAAAGTILLLTTLAWPIAVVARRRMGGNLQLQEREARACRLARLGAVTGLVFMTGWAALIVADVSSTDKLDAWIRLVQLIGLLCVAGVGFAVWNAWLTCTGHRSRWAKAWSVVLALALLDLVWFSFAFSLISAGLNY